MTTFRNLRSAWLSDTGDALFRHLAALDHLEELCTTLQWHQRSHDFAPGMTNPQPLPKGSFPALRRLMIPDTGDNTTIFHVLSAVSSIFLSSLSVGFWLKFSSDALRCVEGLSSLPSLQSLRRLEIHIGFKHRVIGNLGGTGTMDIAFSDFLRPLLHLRGLEDIALGTHLSAWSISDDDIEMVKITWPHLVRLSVRNDTTDIIQNRWWPGVPTVRPSLSTLVAFAESCPQLETLDVEVAGIEEEELIELETRAAQTAAQPSPQTALQTITFARHDYRERIVLPDVGRLAEALHRLFPRLGGLGDPIEDRVGREGQAMYDGWLEKDMRYEVFRLLETLENLKRTSPFF